MIATEFQEAFSKQWLNIYVPNSKHELVILRKIIPWQWLVSQLSSFYSQEQGKIGKSLRILVAVQVLQFLRGLSDRKVVEGVQENRYMQYFCNVPEKDLFTFMHPTTLVKFRKRLGIKGIALIEAGIFDTLKWAGMIDRHDCLMDSSVQYANILYPTDVLLLYKAIKKMSDVACHDEIDYGWDQKWVKKRWRAYGREKKAVIPEYLQEFFGYFTEALIGFRKFCGETVQGQRLLPLLTC